MKKILIIILFIIIFIVLIYSGLWFVIMFSLSHSINQKYSGVHLNIGKGNNNPHQQYLVKFSKVQPYGFPFKLGIMVINWQEESINRAIEFTKPINIGYDLLGQKLFINFSGEALGKFKPVQRGFGVKFYNENCILSAKIPLNLKLFKMVLLKKNLFEFLNLIENIKFISDKTQIFDLVDNQKLYEEDHTILTMLVDKRQYYTSKQDFLNNIPQKLEFYYETEIIQSNLEDRIIPAGLLLYRPAWNNNFKFSGNFLISTSSLHFKDIAKDLTIKVNNAKINSNNFENNMNLLYKGKLNDFGNSNIHLSIESQFKLKPGFIIGFLEFLKKNYDKQTYLLKFSDNKIYKNFNNELVYILNNNKPYNFSILEDRPYHFNFNINLVTELKKLTRVQINTLSLYSNTSGFNITNETIINDLKDSYTKGIIVINNYSKIIEILSFYIYGVGSFKNLSKESQIVHIEALQSFLKTISDHPNSSNLIDTSIKYEFNLSDLNKAKIGNIDDINKLIPLYYLSLYQAAVKKMEPGANVKEKILELIPSINQKILEECVLSDIVTQ
ncbi:hypothetical protein [Rickettsia prowazekii]|uniref:Uncharacterized protein RP478 n=2 Tax=Rickettsia prowazekii TaxID=782 RepID=Y478_RICPR|nr:hypothetical protein [Rickettsia prowazekii]Q9ZD66.1 RecName: Full=Uncharacterized protein RP478; Flags: Precursor [Rickettsia prowazekii str. Madrid E]ADE30010.1 hypothetical protein rpr22_CDS467 [Rickettsia prowazekii str. Rp22]AFE49289.1 hypothetical protein M9W_02320 [Rickettsia prowazekii str. Chernikova]AFE50135.1 hypothetical protein M9Y_02325 [Rickettsia prowazekii str. Katsinyian]AFE50980.1 hypothetical protein MA1_02320 [Rickettsia prowazekii str. BuV67-CWPP]AFE51816.1 hypothetic